MCKPKRGEVIIISAAVVTYRDGAKAQKAAESILKNTKRYPLKLYIIDNASPDGTADLFENTEGVTLVREKQNLGFGAAHNEVLKSEIGKYHFVINPDITFYTDVLSDIVDYMEKNPDVAMLMPRILNPDGSEQFLPKEIPTFRRLFLGRLSDKIRKNYTWADRKIKTVTDVDFCTGCFFCIRGEVFKAVNGFSPQYFMYLEDADLTLKAKKYGRTVMHPDICVTHAWERGSSKNLKLLIIHTKSALKFLAGKRKLLK